MLDPAQRQQFDRIKAEGAPVDGILDRRRHLGQGKHLQQAQHLNELPPALLLQTSLQQASKLGKHRGQGPALERRGLIQGPGLALQQSQVVQWIKHEVAALIGALVPRDDLAGVADHHRIHVPFHLDLAMAIAGRHGVVVAAVTHQADRAHPARPLIAGIKGNRGKRTAGHQVLGQPLVNGLARRTSRRRSRHARRLFRSSKLATSVP